MGGFNSKKGSDHQDAKLDAMPKTRNNAAKDPYQRVAAQRTPVHANLKDGKTYYYCDCGRSKNQPFCDSSHKGTPFTPIAFTVPETKTYYICGCKQTKNAPFCDGTHTKIDW